MDNDVKEEAQYELDVSDAQETEVELGEEPKIVEEEPQETVAEVVTEDDSEHEEYSASVKKRINRLTKKCVKPSVNVKKLYAMPNKFKQNPSNYERVSIALIMGT